MPEANSKAALADAVDLIKAYAKQETVGPLKNLGRYLGFGIAGALLMGLGLFFLAMAGLRALQSETGPHLTGGWSWLPYLVVAIGGLLVAALFALRIKKGDLGG